MDGKQIALKVLNLDGLKSLILDDLLEQVVHEKLKELAAKSENSLDDSLVAMIMPFVKAEADKFLSEKIAELQAQ